MAAPVYLSITAYVGSPVVYVTYDQELDPNSVPAAYGFGSARVGGAVSIAGAVVGITTDTPFTAGEIESLNYTPGATPVQNLAGEDAPAISGQRVTVLPNDALCIRDANISLAITGNVSLDIALTATPSVKPALGGTVSIACQG